MFSKQINNFLDLYSLKQDTLVFIFFTALTLLLTNFIFNDLKKEFTYFILLVLVIMFGLPHGALDTLMAKRFGIYKDIKGVLIFNFIYVFIAILTFIFWNFFSALSLFLFLLISAYHFSEDWKNNMNIFNRLIIGFSIINLPLFFHQADVLQIYNYITDDLVMQEYINLIINIIYVNIILLVLVAVKNIKNFNIFIQIITILVSSYALNPLYFFMCYFCFFHSLKNYKESVSFLNNEKKSKINIVVLLNIIITIMMGIIYFYYFIGSYSPANISKLIFIGLAALTVPHMILKFIISYKTQ